MNIKFPFLFTGSSHPLLAQELAQLLNISLGNIAKGCFADGEIAIEILEDVRNQDVFVMQSLALEPNFYLMELLIMVDALKRASAKSITALIPYFGYARQDRITEPRVPITAKLVANLIARSGVSHVITMDLHAPQIEGFFDIPIDNLLSERVLIPAAKTLKSHHPIIVAPDIGSSKIANHFARQLDTDMAIIDKQRISSSEVSMNLLIGDVKGRDVILVDDLCSTGGTLVAAAKACREIGAKDIYAFVSHGLFVGESVKNIESSPIKALVTTNSIQNTNRLEGCSKIRWISIAPLYREAYSSEIFI